MSRQPCFTATHWVVCVRERATSHLVIGVQVVAARDVTSATCSGRRNCQSGPILGLSKLALASPVLSFRSGPRS